MWDLQRTKEFMEDETTCGPLCQHPSCWSSSNRKIKGIPHYAPRIPSPDSIETGKILSPLYIFSTIIEKLRI